VGARPFHLIRFSAPGPEERFPVRLEVEAMGENGGKVKLEARADFPLPEGSSLSLFDVSKTFLPFDDLDREGPRALGEVLICGEETWALGPTEGSTDMMLVVSPGDLEVGDGVFEFQFDRKLKEIPEGVVVFRLEDLGEKEDCQASGPGFPRQMAVEVELSRDATRLIVTTDEGLPAGHRFRLELDPRKIFASGTGISSWPSLPRRFDFATRGAADRTLGGLPSPDPFGPNNPNARDMVQIGNLMLVAADGGEVLAFDVSDVASDNGFERISRLTKGVRGTVRSLATDGHGRVFWTGLYGPLWAVKWMRIEDIIEAGDPCGSPPPWAAGIPCFQGKQGSIRIAYLLGTGNLTASEWLASGTLPSGTPMDMELLVQDERGKALSLAAFVEAYTGQEIDDLQPDASGTYTFDIELLSTLKRSQAGTGEPSLPPDAPPAPAIEAWRNDTCSGEEDWDHYQRTTIDNLTTGESWSIDLENPWPESGASGTGTVEGVHARLGDELQVRYNLRTLGYIAIMGSGITTTDLNRAYRDISPGGGVRQCGRRLGQFEGEAIEFPACAEVFGSQPEGLSLTPSVAITSTTGCDEGPCRGDSTIDVYSPLIRVGVAHGGTSKDRPAGFGQGSPGDSLQLAQLAACIKRVDDQHVFLRDIAIAADVEWVDHRLLGSFSGGFVDGSTTPATVTKRGDLLFVSLGLPGVFVFDISDRWLGEGQLVGHLSVSGHSALHVQADAEAGLLFSGGTDAETGDPRCPTSPSGQSQPCHRNRQHHGRKDPQDRPRHDR